jgi:hypothetical protein
MKARQGISLTQFLHEDLADGYIVIIYPQLKTCGISFTGER